VYHQKRCNTIRGVSIFYSRELFQAWFVMCRKDHLSHTILWGNNEKNAFHTKETDNEICTLTHRFVFAFRLYTRCSKSSPPGHPEPNDDCDCCRSDGNRACHQQATDTSQPHHCFSNQSTFSHRSGSSPTQGILGYLPVSEQNLHEQWRWQPDYHAYQYTRC
jgi:hypothetical protein